MSDIADDAEHLPAQQFASIPTFPETAEEHAEEHAELEPCDRDPDYRYGSTP